MFISKCKFIFLLFFSAKIAIKSPSNFSYCTHYSLLSQFCLPLIIITVWITTKFAQKGKVNTSSFSDMLSITSDLDICPPLSIIKLLSLSLSLSLLLQRRIPPHFPGEKNFLLLSSCSDPSLTMTRSIFLQLHHEQSSKFTAITERPPTYSSTWWQYCLLQLAERKYLCSDFLTNSDQFWNIPSANAFWRLAPQVL